MSNVLKLLLIVIGITFSYADNNASSKQNRSVEISTGEAKDIIVTSTITYGDYPTTGLVSPFDGFLTVIDIDTKGQRSLLFPNKNIPDTYVDGNSTMSMLEEGTFKESLSTGLHYLMIVFSEKRVVLSMSFKDKVSFDAFKDDKQFNKVLEELQSGKFGKFIFKMLPVYKE